MLLLPLAGKLRVKTRRLLSVTQKKEPLSILILSYICYMTLGKVFNIPALCFPHV